MGEAQQDTSASATTERAPRGSKQTYLMAVSGEDGNYVKTGEGKEHAKGIVDDLLVRGYKFCKTQEEYDSGEAKKQNVVRCVAGAIKTPTLPQPQVVGL